MSGDSSQAMATWLGTLARGGVLRTEHEEAGVAVAAYVVGEERLGELRRWMSEQPADVVGRETRAAIEVCIWMAHADRELAQEEKDLLRQLVLASGLEQEPRDELIAAIEDPPPLDKLEKQLTHQTLRELLLALSWELALADGRVDRFERDFYVGLAKRLDVPSERALSIRGSMDEQIV